jgi:hypothetical protein
VIAGGVHGWTIVVAAVVVVVIVAISAVGDCCSWKKVVMLERCAFDGGCSGGSIRLVDSLVGSVASVPIFMSVGSVLCCVGLLSLLESGDSGLGRAGSSSEDSIVASCSDGRLSVTGLGAATRAGAHVSCATGQGSVIV